MEIPVLRVEQRESGGKGAARQLRFKGLIPGVCYGKQKEPLPLTVNPEELTTILKGPRGLNSLIRLVGAEDRMVFVQELQKHPVERTIVHVDFLWVDTEKKLQRSIPIKMMGRPAGFKLGGLLQTARRRLRVEALPMQLPQAIEIDVTNMNIGDTIHVAELEMPEGVKALFERNFTICAVIAPVVEETKTEEVEEEEAAAGAESAAADSDKEKKD